MIYKRYRHHICITIYLYIIYYILHVYLPCDRLTADIYSIESNQCRLEMLCTYVQCDSVLDARLWHHLRPYDEDMRLPMVFCYIG